MELHRALLRGEGFYDWMSKSGLPATLRPLPVENLLAIDKEYGDAIVAEALPQDRARFRTYLSHRPLGLGIVTGGPGFGKTTAAAACTLAMEARFGHILCSGPNHVAIDNFTERIDRRSRAVVARCNVEKRALGSTPDRRRPLIVRYYKQVEERKAFKNLLQDPMLMLSGDAAPRSMFRRPSKWRFHLSSSFWFLVVLRSPLVKRDLHPDDSEVLHAAQKQIDEDPALGDLRAVATQYITWDEFKETRTFDHTMQLAYQLLDGIPDRADILCVSATDSEIDEGAKRFKRKSGGIVIDEAAAMLRADLLCVWGNILSPCFVIGDLRQLPPKVVMGNATWPDSKDFINRFALEAKISGLEYLQACGMPTYRLKTQVRMVNGMFDAVSEIMYPDVPFAYNVLQDPSYSDFKIGRDLESFAQAKYPDLRPCPPGTLKPFFIHCEGATIVGDVTSGSKPSPDQVKVALDFALDFVREKEVRTSQISIIAPDTGNVALINSQLKLSRYSDLQGLPAATTVDSFQGQENDVIVAVTGSVVTQGPGPIADARRLNVMLTRGKCGLVIIGNIYVADAVPDPRVDIKPKVDGKEPIFTVQTATGGKVVIKASELRKLYRDLHDTGRVARIVIEGKGNFKIKEEEAEGVFADWMSDEDDIKEEDFDEDWSDLEESC